MESGGSAYNDSELLQYINELHEQLKSKDDHIETIKEEMRCSSSRIPIRVKSLIQVNLKVLNYFSIQFKSLFQLKKLAFIHQSFYLHVIIHTSDMSRTIRTCYIPYICSNWYFNCSNVQIRSEKSPATT